MGVKGATSRGVYFDRSLKSDGTQRRHHKFRAEVDILGRRYRKRFQTREEAQAWIRVTIRRWNAKYRAETVQMTFEFNR